MSQSINNRIDGGIDRQDENGRPRVDRSRNRMPEQGQQSHDDYGKPATKIGHHNERHLTPDLSFADLFAHHSSDAFRRALNRLIHECVAGNDEQKSNQIGNKKQRHCVFPSGRLFVGYVQSKTNAGSRIKFVSKIGSQKDGKQRECKSTDPNSDYDSVKEKKNRKCCSN